MNALPLELHSCICEFACTDDGYTARALGLVSKYFRAAVNPFQYNSIAVSGQLQISQLEFRLQRTPLHLRRVRNLFISDRDDLLECQTLSKCGNSHTARLLALVSTTVEVMTIHCDNPRISTSMLAFLFGLHYPRLRDLTIIGYYPFPHVPNAMPRLKHLHLNGNRNPHGLLQIGCLDIACPELTHICISGLARAISFVSELEEALMGDEESRSSFNSNLPRSLRHVIVQPGPMVPSQRKGTSLDDCMIEQLANLVDKDGMRRDVQFTLLGRSDCKDVAVMARKQWLQRLDSAGGDWPLLAN